MSAQASARADARPDNDRRGPRTSNALNGLPLNSRTNSLAAAAERSWMRTIDREGERSRIMRRHSISGSSACTYLRKSAGEK
jgi:hypothetical protein